MTGHWHVGVDIGGTFTDVVAVNVATHDTRYLKVASSRTDPASAVIRGVEALRDEEGIQPADLRLVLHGTTLATNAIIERKLARTALVTPKGFKDVLEIARTWRSDLYNPFFDQAAPLVSRELRFEADERMSASGKVVKALEPDEIARVVDAVRASGVDAVAVAFLHSYVDPSQEELLTAALRRENGWFVCGSAELLRELREYERTATTVLNVALMPLIDAYLTRLERGLQEAGADVSLFISQSNGGAQTPELARERPVSLALSGPVAGVVALGELARSLDRGELIGLDMGGTSTDVSLISGFEPRYTTQLSVGDLPVRLPSIEINAIGAGGGSLASVDAGGTLRVGPESAGSDPGPAAYGAGGTRPTVTDSQLMLGRLSGGFALAGRLSLDRELAAAAIEQHVGEPLGLDAPAAAAGIVQVTNASMERAVRVTLRARGDDPRDFALVAFGGAGPLHACELARDLNVSMVIVPNHPGTLCAAGLLQADVRLDFAASELRRSDGDGLVETLNRVFDELAVRARERFEADPRLDASALQLQRTCDVRYLGQAYDVAVPVPDGEIDTAAVDSVLAGFHERHQRAYAFSSPDEPCEFVTFRVTAVMALEKPPSSISAGYGPVEPVEQRPAYELGVGFQVTPVFDRPSLPIGHVVRGPAIVQQKDATTWIPSYASAEVHESGNLIIAVRAGKAGADGLPEQER
jgi:N-methylhydantoinase A